MSQEVKIDAAIIKKTQDTLGRIISAPSLTDKLLNRPPVQFIQDIVKSVIKNTGFMKGLYNADELDSAFIKSSKENKILFLNKVIIFVGLVVGEQLSVKANKIAAGVEAEKTNELLQNLAKAINIKPDNDDFVKKTLKQLKSMENKDDKNEKEDKPREKSRPRDDDEKPDKHRDKDRDEKHRDKDREERHKDKDRDEKHRDKDREERHKDKDRDEKHRDKDREERHRDKDRDEKHRDKDREERHRDKDRDEKHRDRDEKDKDRHKERSRDKDKDKDRDEKRRGDKDRDEKDKHRDKDKDRSKHRDSSANKENEKRRGEKEVEKPKPSKKDSDDDEDDFSRDFRNKTTLQPPPSNEDENPNDESNVRRRPSSARGRRVLIEREENNEQNNLEESRTLTRPTTARPHAPRVKLTNESDDVQSKLNSSLKKSTVIGREPDSDSDDFVVQENKFQEDEAATNRAGGGKDSQSKRFDVDEDETGDNHGALVKKILESKEQLEYENDPSRNKGDNKPLIQMDLQRKKEKERVQKEIDKLKESIQTLTKASIPLGRTLDFLQEDVDMMQKEIGKWSEEYDHNLRALKRQQTETQSFLEPYRSALNEIETQISEQLEKISSVKRKILLNEEKISRLIFNVGKNG